jgi:predicted ATPase/class 3 adenylate cyclase
VKSSFPSGDLNSPLTQPRQVIQQIRRIGTRGGSRRRGPNKIERSRTTLYVVADVATELPEGTVTLLFSDIEGSTALLAQLGDQYGQALSTQRVLLREAFHRSGRELGTEGDSFYVVFQSAVDAVNSCVAAQRAVANHVWPGGAAVRVRMGLHSGEPVRHEAAYVGMDVHRAARIASTAHGGQVVISDVTRQLVESHLPDDVTLRDLGWHRLKDISDAEHIFQLVVTGLPDRFPALKSLGARTSLPIPPTPLVARVDELELLRATVVQSGVRLVTLVGPGGVGKTRLALAGAAQLSEAFQHGVYYLPMAALDDARTMWGAIAEALGVSDDGPALSVVTEYLKDRHTLLILDNLEQLVGAADVIASLLAGAPRLVVLVTSRRPLHLPGERELPLAPLDVPASTDVDAVLSSGAAQMFVQHAQMVKPAFALSPDNASDVAEICGHLDGLPLALELTASRIKVLTPKALLSNLGMVLDFTSAVGHPSRQQNLRTTIKWSCDLLRPDIATMFYRAGVFSGGCGLEALAAVARTGDEPLPLPDALDLIGELQDASLVTVGEGSDGEPRLGMLETIRKYSIECLEASGELDLAQRLHGNYFATLAEESGERLSGAHRLTVLDRLETEHDNMRAALRWSFHDSDLASDDVERKVIGLRLVRALAQFWYEHGHASEGRSWLELALATTSDDVGEPLAHVAHWLGVLLQQQGENEAALVLLERSLSIWNDLGDRRQMARELNSLGITHRHLGHLDTARTLLEDSITISREFDDGGRLAAALTSLSHVETDAGNLDRADVALREALQVDRRMGDELGVTIDLQSLAVTSLCAGRPVEANDLLLSTLPYVIASGHLEFLATTVELSAAIAASLGENLRAARLWGASEGIRQKLSIPISQPDDNILERFMGPARADVDQIEWDSARRSGRELSHQQSVALMMAHEE